MQPEQSLPFWFYIWIKLKQETRYAGLFNMVQSSWAMENRVRLKMLINQLAWHGRFSDFSRLEFVLMIVDPNTQSQYHLLIWLFFFTWLDLQFVNDLHALISPPPQGTPLPVILLGKVWNCCWLSCLLSTCAYFFYMMPITVQKCIIVDIFAAGPSRLGRKNRHLQGKEF